MIPARSSFEATARGLSSQLQTGEFILRKSQTPDELVTALLDPGETPYVDIAIRSQLRLEQVTALLQKLKAEQGLEMDVQEFYDLATDPPSTLLEDYPWLRTALAGAPGGVDPTLEGFLWPATYRVLPDTSAEELIRLMLDKFIAQVGEERLKVPKDRGMTFYEVLTLASIVEREAVLPEEKPLIAGVYQNRINGIKGVKNRLLNADPTVIYGADSVALAETPLEEWLNYFFWKVPETPMKDIALPGNLQGFQTYQVPGLVPWPICDTEPRFDRCSARPGHQGQVHLLPGDPRQRRQARVRQDEREAPGEPREVRLQLMAVARGALPEPADFAPPPSAASSWPPGTRPTGLPGPHASRGSARGSRRRASTRISAFVASTCAISPASRSPRARRSRRGTPGSSW